MPSKDTTPLSLYGNDREYLREQERTNELLADIAGETYESPGNIPNGKYILQKRMLDAAQKKNELLESIAGGGGAGGGAAKGIDIDYGTDVISLTNKDGDPIQGSGATLPAYGVSFDPTTGGLTLTKNGTAMQGQTVTIPNYGSPVGVTSASDMTDEGTIYLYEGTTGGGYTQGHFYYWDGTAWADGGEYAAATVQTDKTLLVENRAADAKATGEAVSDLKKSITENESTIKTAATTGSLAIDLSSAEIVNRIINTSSKWTATSGSQSGMIIRIPVGMSRIKIAGVSGSVFAFLKSIDNMNTNNATPDFCDGYTARISVTDTDDHEYVVNDCQYIWAYKTNSSGEDISIASVTVYTSIASEKDISDSEMKIYSKMLVDAKPRESEMAVAFITSSNNWTTAAGQGWMHKITYENILEIKSNPNESAVIAFLTDNVIVNNSKPHFSIFYKARILVDAGEIRSFMIPTDAKYVFIAMKTASNTNVTPTSIKTDAERLITKADENIIDTTGFGIEWEGGRIINGENSDSTYYCRMKGFIDASLLPEKYMYTGPKTLTKSGNTKEIVLIVNEYMNPVISTASFLQRQILNSQNPVYTRSPNCLFIRFSIGTGSPVQFTVDDAENSFSISMIPYDDIFTRLFSDVDWKTSIALARTRQVTSVRYQPLAIMPNQSNDFTPDKTYIGVPYSSTRALDTYVGLNVSLDTFCSALHNPKSVLYTRKSIVSNSKTYYGMVCSSLACFLLGIGAPVNTFTMGDSPDFEERDFYAMKVGYVFVNSSHAYVIYGIRFDAYRRPIEVGIAEAAPPRVFYHNYTIDALKTKLNTHPGGAFKLYEYVGTADQEYVASKYVQGYPDEVTTEEYPDIMTEYGDFAVLPAGVDVTINIINSTGYTSVNVYKDSVLTQSGLPVEDFTIENPEYGTYKVELVGDGKTSETQFIAVDMAGCSYDPITKKAKFASANATPVYINAYDAMTESYTKADMRNFAKLTSSDITAGASENGMDVTNIVTDDYPYIRIEFQTPWGQAVWRSYDLNAWEPFSV